MVDFMRIFGCIAGAAIGDAMGAPTECRSAKQIAETFGGRVTEFKVPPKGSLAYGRKAGQVTDAFSIPYTLLQHIVAAEGKANCQVAQESLKDWGNSEWFGPFAGMTTRKVVQTLNNDNSMGTWALAGRLGTKLYKSHYYALSSNGAAVKAYPAGLLRPGNIEAAIELAVELTMASHDDPISVAGAAAVAAAISRSLAPDATIYEMTQAAFYGAEKGDALARQRANIWIYPGPSVYQRLEMAVELCFKESDDYMADIRDLIGCGPSVTETVPAAFGLVIAHGGEAMPALYDAVNIGDETAAIASIVGALSGALHGIKAFKEEDITFINQANGFDLKAHAQEIWELIN